MSTAALMVAGLLAGHSLAYRLTIPDAHARADALARSGHGYLSYAPLALTVCLGLLLCSLAARSLAGFRGEPTPAASSRAIVLLPPLAFVVQEYAERLVYTGHMPWTVAVEPSFLVGVAFQLPVALAALLIAWALDTVAYALGCAVAAVSPPPLALAFVAPAAVHASTASPPVGLARGYGERAPPSFRRV
jgi:hypothetical protein